MVTRVFEYALAVTLACCVALTLSNLRPLAARERRLQQQPDAASGAFEAVMLEQVETPGTGPVGT